MDRSPAGQSSNESGDAARLRVSDADRQRVADLLREAAAEGRLELEELEERLESAYTAKVAADLVPLVADLPAGLPSARTAPAPPAPGGGLARHGTSIAIMSGCDRRGPWEIEPTHTAAVFMGGADIDLREAVFLAPETVITAVAVMGGIDVVVGPDVRVSVEGVGIMGAFDEMPPKVAAELRDDSPLVRVRGAAIMGAVEVHRKGDPA